MEPKDPTLEYNLKCVNTVTQIIGKTLESTKGVQESGRAMFTKETVARVKETEEDMER